MHTRIQLDHFATWQVPFKAVWGTLFPSPDHSSLPPSHRLGCSLQVSILGDNIFIMQWLSTSRSVGFFKRSRVSASWTGQGILTNLNKVVTERAYTMVKTMMSRHLLVRKTRLLSFKETAPHLSTGYMLYCSSARFLFNGPELQYNLWTGVALYFGRKRLCFYNPGLPLFMSHIKNLWHFQNLKSYYRHH